MGGVMSDWLLEQLANPDPGVAVPPGTLAEQLKTDNKAAADKVVAATRKAFGLKPFVGEDGKRSGTTRQETMTILSEFLEFVSGAVKDSRGFVTSRPRDAPSPSEDCPAGLSSACGSAGT
jgi:hypothetical protein